MNLPFEYDRVHAAGRVRRHHSDDNRFRPAPGSSSCRSRSTGPRPTSPARGTVRTRSWSRRRTWSCGTRRPETDVHGIGIFTLPRDGVSVRDDGRGDARDPARGVRTGHARQVSVRARRRAFDHRAGRRRARRAAHRSVGAADRRARRSARLVHGHAAQSRVRHAPGARARTRRRRSGSAACPRRSRDGRRRLPTTIFYDFNMRQDAQLDRPRRRLARRGPCTSPSTATDSIRRSCRRSARPSREACAGTRRWPCCAA